MAKERKSNAGRPKTNLDLPEGWHDKVLDLYKEGGSDAEVKALIWDMRNKSFSNNLWDRWLKEEPEFWETIKMGRMLSASWWHNKGRKNLVNKDFSYTGWYMNMKNRFGWSDKTDINQTTVQYQSAPMSKEEIQDISKGLEEEY